MSSDKSRPAEKERIVQEAAECFISRDLGLSAVEEKAYQAWLKGDPRHRASILRREETWGRFSSSEDFEEALDEPGIAETPIESIPVDQRLRHKRFRFIQAHIAIF